MARKKTSPRKKKSIARGQARYQLLPPKNAEIANALAAAQRFNQSNSPEKGIELCLQALEIEPSCAECHLVLAECYEAIRDIENSNESYISAQKVYPNFVPGIVNHGLMLYSNGFLERSLTFFLSAVALDDTFLPALQGALNTLVDLRRYEQAVGIAEKIWRIRNGASDQLELARVKDLSGDSKGALKILTQALATSNMVAQVENLRGLISMALGESETSRQYFLSCLAHDPENGFAHLYLARDKNAEMSLAQIQATIEVTADRPIANVRAPLQFACAHLHERAGDFESAFMAFETANELVCSIVSDDNDARADNIRSWLSTCDRLQANDIKGNSAVKPIFVTGLPRSGTTLVEQIISAHSLATGFGELELMPHLVPSIDPSNFDSIRRAAQSYVKGVLNASAQNKRSVDKSISSVLYVGFILTMFPNAKIVYCDRHPMDTAWSAYKEYFNAGSLAYTYSFERIAKHQHIYADLIEHWITKYPDQIMRVRYEDLVQEPEAHTRNLLKHVDLPWEPECLEFHNSTQSVRTASLSQVRQPIYASSIERWKPCEPWLGELKSLLDDLINKYEASSSR